MIDFRCRGEDGLRPGGITEKCTAQRSKTPPNKRRRGGKRVIPPLLPNRKSYVEQAQDVTIYYGAKKKNIHIHVKYMMI